MPAGSLCNSFFNLYSITLVAGGLASSLGFWVLNPYPNSYLNGLAQFVWPIWTIFFGGVGVGDFKIPALFCLFQLKGKYKKKCSETLIT